MGKNFVSDIFVLVIIGRSKYSKLPLLNSWKSNKSKVTILSRDINIFVTGEYVPEMILLETYIRKIRGISKAVNDIFE